MSSQLALCLDSSNAFACALQLFESIEYTALSDVVEIGYATRLARRGERASMLSVLTVVCLNTA